MYSVDSNPYVGSAGNRILMELGKAMERMLTLSDQDYNKYIVKDVGRESVYLYLQILALSFVILFQSLLFSIVRPCLLPLSVFPSSPLFVFKRSPVS